MKILFLTITMAFLCLVFSGCTSQRKILDSWMGSSKYALIQSWGPPARTADDGNGGEILIYGRHIYAPNLNLNYWEYKMMYTNADGKIYHWRISREQVPPTEVDVRFLN